MTNPIASDTCTTSFNPLKTWKNTLAGWAQSQNRSLGKSLIYLAEKGAEIEDPELAKKLKEARLKRYASLLIVGLGLSFAASSYVGSQDTRRPTRRVARARVYQFLQVEIQAA